MIHSADRPRAALLLGSRSIYRALPALAAVGLLLDCAKIAQAQQASAATEGLEEIVVTANKRNEDIQDVPIAIEALTASELGASGISGTQDLTTRISGLNFEAQEGATSPFLRGVGTAAIGVGNVASVATYVDGVVIEHYTGDLLQLSNVQQVEVDKGPQGTLFGRNTTGGVINITTLTPSHDFHGDVGATYGNYNAVTTSAYVTGGLTSNLASDLSLYYSNQGDGFGRNVFTGDDIYKNGSLAVRNKWLYTPTDIDTFTLSFDYNLLRSSGLGAASTLPGTYGNYGRGTTLAGQRPDLAPYVASGELSPAFVTGDPEPHLGGTYDIDNIVDPHATLQQGGGSLKWLHTFSFAQFLSISSYRESQDFSVLASTGNPANDEIFGWTQGGHTFTEELQLLSPVDSKVKWVGGLFYLGSHDYYPNFFAGGPAEQLPPGGTLQFRSDESTESAAAFGQLTTPLFAIPQTNVTLGARYTREKRGIVGDLALAIDGQTAATLIPPVDADATFSKVTYRISLDHHFTDDILTYLSWNTGFKSGLFNSIPVSGTPTQPEEITAYEVGFKSDFFDRKLRLNASAFYYDWRDLQVTVTTLTTAITTNAARAKLYGIDFDLQARPTEHLTLSAAVEQLKDYYSNYNGVPFFGSPLPLSAGGGVAQIGIGSAAGKELPYAPKFTGNLAADYVVPIPQGQLGVNLTYYFNDGYFATPDNNPLVGTGPYHLLSSRLEWTSPNGNSKVYLWGKNLLNQDYSTFSAAFANPGGSYSYTLAPPRTYGVGFEQKF